MTIEAPHYRETRDRLKADPIVRQLALDVQRAITRGEVKREDLAHEGGHPRFEFMQRANAEYARLKGDADTGRRHIGAVAEAILMLLDEEA